MQLYFAVLVCVFGYGVTDVEGPFGLYEASVSALAECDTRKNVVGLVVNEFELDVFLPSANNLACALVVDVACAEQWFGVLRAERTKFLQFVEERCGYC